MEGPDRAGGPGSPGRRSGDRGLRGPGSSTHVIRVPLPTTWPEAAAWTAGERLCRAEEDDVPMLMRQGLPYWQRLYGDEVDAHLRLGGETFERWFHAGWRYVATALEES